MASAIIPNLSLLFLVITVVMNILLAYFVIRSNSKSATNRTFAFLAVSINIWIVAMYVAAIEEWFSYGWILVRATFVLATPMNALFFLLAITLPSERFTLRKHWLQILICSTTLLTLLLVTPYGISEVHVINGAATPIPNLGLVLFGIFSIFTIFGAVYVLIKKYRRSNNPERTQYRLMVTGILIMFSLVFVTIFFPVLFIQNASFVFLTPIYTLFFLSLTAYAIVKTQLFNIKIVATEALTAMIWLALLAKMLVNTNFQEIIIEALIFLATLILGLFLIKSVRGEVKQRQQLEILTKELEMANDKLKALDQARVDFITIASHQLRTPPATIKWYLSAIKGGDYGELPKDAADAIVRAEATNNSLISLINDLLNASRIERGKMEFNFTETNVQEIAEITIDQIRPLAKIKKLEINYQKSQQPLPLISADKEKLRQVMNNFIDNAIKYTKQGSIDVELFEDDGNIRFQVKDSGKGIDGEFINTIFQKYSRGNDLATHSTGLGLGLYVARVIISQHGGKIWVESQGEGKGSTFIFTVPIKGTRSSSTLDLSDKPIAQ